MSLAVLLAGLASSSSRQHMVVFKACWLAGPGELV